MGLQHLHRPWQGSAGYEEAYFSYFIGILCMLYIKREQFGEFKENHDSGFSEG